MILVFGWIAVAAMVLFVGASMAEIASAYPTSGALYFSAGKLAKRHRGAWSWYTGWLNFVGQVGGTAATGYAAAPSSRRSSPCSGRRTRPPRSGRC